MKDWNQRLLTTTNDLFILILSIPFYILIVSTFSSFFYYSVLNFRLDNQLKVRLELLRRLEESKPSIYLVDFEIDDEIEMGQ